MAHILSPIPIFLIVTICILAIFDAVLKLFAMWKAARNNQSGWFVCLAIFKTCGILPIIYLILHKDDK